MIDVSVVSNGIAQAQSALLVVVGGLMALSVGFFGALKINQFLDGKRIRDDEWSTYCERVNAVPLAGDGMTTEEYMQNEADLHYGGIRPEDYTQQDGALRAVVSRDYDVAMAENKRRDCV